MAEDEAPPSPRKRRQPRKRTGKTAETAAAPTPTAGPGEPPTDPAEAAAPPEAAKASAAETGPGGAEPHAAGKETVPLVVTLFGGSGFVGKSLVARLVEHGARVKIATRHPEGKPPPRSQCPGTVETVRAGIDDEAAVQAAVSGATVVINLVGILHESGKQGFEAVHVEGARRVAAAAKAAGVRRLVHMSALGASPRSPSKYARTKAGGEKAVLECFGDASIVRPSIVFGPDDDFFNRFAEMAKLSPALPLIGGGTTRFQPVYVDDVAAAFVCIVVDDDARGKTYELGGPRVYTFKELMELMLHVKGTSRLLVPIPFFLAEIQGSVLQMLPTPPLTRDQVELLKTDNVLGGSAPGLESLGVTPTPLEEVLPTYL